MTVVASPVIVALDFDNKTKALSLVDKLDPTTCRVKVGKEMFTRFGPAFIQNLHDRSFDVFLDLKFHDIPNTVNKAIAAVADLGVWMTTVHAAGGPKMLEMAKAAIDERDHKPLLVAVTMLTSMEESCLKAVGINQSPFAYVSQLAALASQSGLDGIVCSALELSHLKDTVPTPIIKVTPGIRPEGSQANDQARITTPKQAIDLGANYLVIGRPITQHASPSASLQSILKTIK